MSATKPTENAFGHVNMHAYISTEHNDVLPTLHETNRRLRGQW